MNRNEKYFKTNEFAKLNGVSKQKIIFYHKKGLLFPSFISESGYRYYSLKKMEQMTFIKLLTSLGLSLKEIKDYMYIKSPENFLELLKEQKQEITKQRKELIKNEALINRKIELLENNLNTDFDDIKIETLPKSHLQLSENLENMNEEKFAQEVSKLLAKLENLDVCVNSVLGYIISKEKFELGDFKNYNYLYIYNYHNTQENSVFFNEQKYMVGYHYGNEDLKETYTKMLRKILHLNLEIDEFVFIEHIYDVEVLERPYITKIMIALKY
ncbi:MerR family transcriptional regulator [Staphylococcus equorum]|uniref:MerR family transcriptional regulator n=1 Tax=Staphylococcus equorum TaxID=246432 RepID=UPI00397F030A